MPAFDARQAEALQAALALAVDDKAWRELAKAAMAEGLQRAEAGFRAATDIQQLIGQRRALIDGLVSDAWRRCVDPRAAVSLLATGGYGRGELYPYSDIDLLVLAEPAVQKRVEPAMSLVRARSTERQSASAHDAAQQAVRRAASARAEAASAVRSVDQRFRAAASEALATTRAQIAAETKSLPALADRMQRTEIRAPVAGLVNRVLVTTPGGSVRPGEPLVEVVPAGDSLVIEAQVKPADIAFLLVGQKANIKISAYDSAIYGAVAGVVEHIAPDAIVDERNGESHFTIRVRTNARALVGEGGVRLPIGAGMTAEVDVLGQRRSVLGYVLTPGTRLRDKAFREKL